MLQRARLRCQSTRIHKESTLLLFAVVVFPALRLAKIVLAVRRDIAPYCFGIYITLLEVDFAVLRGVFMTPLVWMAIFFVTRGKKTFCFRNTRFCVDKASHLSFGAL